jgi:hypothetical protein
MTKYICAKCNEVFTHTARMVLPIEKGDQHINIAIGVSPMFAISAYVETAVCPFCHNIKFTEYVEAPEELSDVISVPYEGVAVKLAEGYKVVEIYAKTITMKLPKKKDTPQQSEDKFTVQAKEYYSMLHPEGQP